MFSKLKRNNGEELFIAPTKPDPKDFQNLLQYKGPFDTFPYVAHSEGFRSLLEGAPWGPGPGNWTGPTTLHARVHEYLGGTMGDVTLSANDPIFFVHHAFVDLIFEEWRRTNLNATYPDDCKVKGSGKYETMPLLVPFRTNQDMYVDVSECGYVYVKAVTDFGDVKQILHQALILVIFVVVLALVLFMFMKIKW